MRNLVVIAIGAIACSIVLARLLNPATPEYAGRDAPSWAAMTLEEVSRVDFDVENEDAIRVARWLLDSDDREDRLAALRLAYQGTILHVDETPRHRRLWLEVLRRLATDVDVEVRVTAASWLAESERTDEVLAALAELIARGGRTVPLLVVEEDAAIEVLARAFRLLAEEGERSAAAIPTLRSLREHHDSRVREAAVVTRWLAGDPDSEAELAEAALARASDEPMLDLPDIIRRDPEVLDRVVGEWQIAVESEDASRRFRATRCIIAASRIANAEAPLLRMLERDGLPDRIEWAEWRALHGSTRLVAAALASRAARGATDVVVFLDPIDGDDETREVFLRDASEVEGDVDVYDGLAEMPDGRTAVEAWAAGHRESQPDAARALLERFEAAVARRR